MSSHQFNVAKLQVFSIRMKHSVNKQVSIFTEYETQLFVVVETIRILVRNPARASFFFLFNSRNFKTNIFKHIIEYKSLFASVILSRFISAFSFHFYRFHSV